MFSIIIPVYNVEKHLDKCLQSVITQTCKDIEIIIVNDGSTDNSARIIERYRLQDGRIKVITQENGGLSAARNSGLEIATHEYIMFIDSDDFIEKNTCELLAEYINKDKGDVYVFGLYYNYDNRQSIGSQRLQYGKYESGTRYMETALSNGNFRTFAHSKLFKNSLLGDDTFAHSEKIRFANSMLYEDMYFVVQALCNAKCIFVVPEYFYHYVQHERGRITSEYREKDLDVLLFIEMLKKEYYETEKINKFIYAVLVFRWVSSCLIYKYIDKYFFNEHMRHFINKVIKDKCFAEATRLCAMEKNISKRDKYLAIILMVCPSAYTIVAYILVLFRKMR